MPARNNVEDIIKEFNNKGKEFGLKNAEILSYQNLKKSSVAMYNLKNEKLIKSAQHWRTIFSQLKKEKQTNEALAIEKAQKTTVAQRAEKTFLKVSKIAQTRQHTIADFKFKKTIKDCTFTVICNIHNTKYKKIHYQNYAKLTTKFGVPCCAATFKTRRKKSPKAKS